MQPGRLGLVGLALAFGCQGAADDLELGAGGSGPGSTGGSLSSAGGAATPSTGGATPTGGSPASAGTTGGPAGAAGTTGGRSSNPGGSAGSLPVAGGAGGLAGGGGSLAMAGGANGGLAGSGLAGSGGRSSGGLAGKGGAAGSPGGGRSASGGASATGGTAGAGSCVENLACKLTPPPSTGDIRQDCVDRINQFLTQCACLPALKRSTTGEACADQMAEYDAGKNSAHAGAIDGICKPSGSQNECPGYASNDQVISLCLQQMWDEGPPPTSSCTGTCYEEHGHFINMTDDSVTQVACGFFTTSAGKVWAAQNFFR